MIYGFMSDRALINMASDVVVELVDVPNTDVGFFDDQMSNYFLTPAKIKDPRADRLTVLAQKGIPWMELHFDNDAVTEIDFNTVDSGELNKLINIVELAYLSQGVNEAAMEALLIGSSDYSIYEPGTIELAAATVVSEFTGLASTISAQDIRAYVSFDVRFGGSTLVSFKIWVGRDAFLADYPISNIIIENGTPVVIFPCDPADMLAPTFTNAMDAIADASGYNSVITSGHMQSTDHSGSKLVQLPYYNASYGSTGYTFTFEVPYKGAEPTISAARSAVRTAIDDLNLAPEATWMLLFPTLYSVAQFWLIPDWTKTFPYGGNPDVHGGIYSVEDFVDAMIGIFTTYTETAIRENVEVVKADGFENIIPSLRDSENDGGYTSLLALHPTYQVDPIGGSMASDTVLFREHLSRAMGIAGETSADMTGLTLETIDSNDYVSFTVGVVEYHVYMMTQS